jgi:hypothetical protein
VLSFLGITWWRLRYRDTLQCFVITKRPAAFLAKMAPQRICRHAGDTKDLVHHPPPDSECRLHTRLHLHPAHYPPHPVTLPELNRLKSSICQPDIRIQIPLFPAHTCSKIRRILSMISILIQICWLMIVSTRSVVW